MQQQVIGQLKTQTIKAIELLKILNVGQSISVEAMSTALGCNCLDGLGRGAVDRARRHVLKNHAINIQWDRSSKVWKRTNDSETSSMMTCDARRARRAARTGQMRARTISFAKLSESERVDTQTTLIQLQLAEMATSNQTRKAIPKHECVIDPERFLLSLRQVK